ncbi:E3 ubiquitin-protein ligase TRIM36-like isoform X5 [Anas acuta]|uniref:E3 ubiquitin-protein ligase TRIM36-like isoform X5 n=1 Tax=Anas acuta TaxID=28680 RepID=UPI0035C8FEF7
MQPAGHRTAPHASSSSPVHGPSPTSPRRPQPPAPRRAPRSPPPAGALPPGRRRSRNAPGGCGMAGAAEGGRFGYIAELLERGKVATKSIERELICPACKELFTHPLILPCQHNVCHKCVKEILFTLEDSLADGGSESSNQSSPRIRISSPSMDRIDRISRSDGDRCVVEEVEDLTVRSKC